MRNHVSHELGHTLGLTHANRSLNKSDCVKGSDSGQFPVGQGCIPEQWWRGSPSPIG